MTGTTHTPPPEVVDALAELGRALGGVAWVQGAGGNASVKADGTLWVKASGRLFSETDRPGGAVGVPESLVLRGLEDPSVEAELFDRTPRPSMETWFHALPFSVVAHTHPAAVLCVACSDLPAPELPGVSTIDLDYVRPGRGLALAMFEAMPAGTREVVFLLRNHGLVVGASSAARCISLSEAYATACAKAVGLEAGPESFVSEWLALPTSVAGDVVARELPLRQRRRGRRRRDLFPDALVYGVPWPVELATLEALPIRVALTRGAAGTTRLMEDDAGRRILVAKDAVSLDRATAIAAVHEWVEARIPASRLRFLPEDEGDALLAMPSEKHRQAVT